MLGLNGIFGGDEPDVKRAAIASTKQLRWKVKQAEGIELMTISPSLAQEMLDYNTSNRPVTAAHVDRLAKQMVAGEWHLTPQPIIFAKSGALQDGQHRLMACVASGRSIQAYVHFGSADENFAYIDVGKVRGPADTFAINGVPSYTATATAMRWIFCYDNDTLSGNKSGLSNSVPAATLYAEYLKHPRLRESLKVIEWFKVSKLAPPSAMVALHYICARKARGEADVFFEGLDTGLNITDRKSPLHRVRTRLVENLSSSAKIPPITIAAYTVKAWNAQRMKQQLKLLRWRGEGQPDETFPKAV